MRQWAALDLGLDPGEPLTDVLFPNFVAANKESRCDRRDVPRSRELAERRDLPRRREELGSHLAAQLRAVRARRRPKPPAAPATPTARSRSCASSNRELLAVRAPSVAPTSARDAAAARRIGAAAQRFRAIPPLTAAQVEVLDLVGRGLDTRAISRRLVVSEATVETHVRQSMQRLGVSTRLAAAVELVRRRADFIPNERRDQHIAVGRSNRPTSRRLRSTSSTCRSHRGRSIPRWSRAWWCADNDDAAPRGHCRVPRRLGRGRDRRCRCPKTARAELLDALARIGPVENLGTATVASEIETDEVMRDALEVLAKGGTVADAAYAVHMSERTLHRTPLDACARSSASAATPPRRVRSSAASTDARPGREAQVGSSTITWIGRSVMRASYAAYPE